MGSEMTHVLPNSLTREIKNTVQWSNGQELLQLFCANCGRPGGLVFRTDYDAVKNFAFYLCDPCAFKWAPLTDTGIVPDEAFWAKVKECLAEDFDHELTPLEIAEALKDEQNPLSKLCRDRYR